MAPKISTSKLKEQCLSLLGHERSDCKDLIGSLRDEIRVKGDTLSTGVKWDAES